MHHGKPTANAYDVATTINLSNAQITLTRTSKIDSVLETAKANTVKTKVAMDKSSADDSSTLSKEKSSITLPVSSAAGEVWPDGAGNGEVGGTGSNRDSGQCSTSLDPTEIKCHPGEPEGKNVKPISMRHRKTGFDTHNSRSTITLQKWWDATPTVSYGRQCNEHLHSTEASQVTWDITWRGTHHHPWPEWRGDATCQQQRQDSDHSPVVGLSCTGWWIGRASHANAVIQSSAWITMDPQKNSWHQLGSPTIDFPAITECERRGGNYTDDYRSGIVGLSSQQWWHQQPASGAQSGYPDTWSNRIWRSPS